MWVVIIAIICGAFQVNRERYANAARVFRTEQMMWHKGRMGGGDMDLGDVEMVELPSPHQRRESSLYTSRPRSPISEAPPGAAPIAKLKATRSKKRNVLENIESITSEMSVVGDTRLSIYYICTHDHSHT
jgi:hypothetical protein